VPGAIPDFISTNNVRTVRILVTGASGFLGRAVCDELVRRGHEVRAMVRGDAVVPPGTTGCLVAGLEDEAGVSAAVKTMDVVVHLAARVHQMRESRADALRRHREANADATTRLARLAATSGVRHLLFASSVKAVGESNTAAWTEEEPARPYDAYGQSKLEAERSLGEITRQTGMATTVLRLPLLYGPGIKANMLRLFELVSAGWPLPLAGIRNRRSLLYVRNAAMAFGSLAGDARGHEVFFAGDGEDLSTPELVVRIAKALGKTPRLVPAPRRALKVLAQSNVPALSAVARRLAGSLVVDTARLRERIGPFPHSVDAGLRETAEWFLLQRAAR
jgi:nucleoside-diphosphate-sugar epimerase